MKPSGWVPVDQALMHCTTVPAQQSRVVEAAARLGVRARQRYADALKPLHRRHPTRGGWTVAQVAAANAAEWRDRGYPSGGDGGRSSGHRDLSDLVGQHDPAAELFWRAQQSAHAVMRTVELGQWPSAYNALCDLLAVMEEAAGLAPLPAPDTLNAIDPSCENHAKHGRWAAPSVTRNGLVLCRYCADSHRTTGQWPDAAWLTAADRNDQRTLRRLRTAAILRTEEETKGGGLIDLATGRVRSVGLAEMHTNKSAPMP